MAILRHLYGFECKRCVADGGAAHLFRFAASRFGREDASMINEPVALVVNAGGQSRRMGREKALLPIPPDNSPLLIHIARRMTNLVSERVVVVTNSDAVANSAAKLQETSLAVDVVADRWVNAGALGGIATGIAHCNGWAMVVACDMPLVDPDIFARLMEMASDRPTIDAVIPRIDGMVQPFHGLWHRRSLPTLEAQIEAGALSVQAALAQLNCLWVDEVALNIAADDPAFFNVNTPQEWEDALRLLHQYKGR